jgi:hypothetical protein
MKHLGILIISILALAAIAPTLTAPAYAHQRQLYNIGGNDYLIVIGSLNEPIFVDDRTGVDLRVLQADPNDPMNSRGEGATPVEGLDQTLQVEIGAGDRTRVMQLNPAFGDPGAYRAPFYPTVATTLTYRVFGTLNDTPVDLTFTCSPAGEAGGEPSQEEVQISDGVIRKGIAGGYGCPEPRTEIGFPEPFVSNNQMATSLEQIQNDVSSIRSTIGAGSVDDNGMIWAAIGLGIAGITIGVVAITRRK